MDNNEPTLQHDPYSMNGNIPRKEQFLYQQFSMFYKRAFFVWRISVFNFGCSTCQVHNNFLSIGAITSFQTEWNARLSSDMKMCLRSSSVFERVFIILKNFFLVSVSFLSDGKSIKKFVYNYNRSDLKAVFISSVGSIDTNFPSTKFLQLLQFKFV